MPNYHHFPKMTKLIRFLELVKLSDTAKQNRLIFDQYASILIVKNDNYHGIVEAAHDRLGPLIEDLTTDEAEIYIHNPPRVLKAYLEDPYKRALIELEVSCEEYEIKRDSELFVDNMNAISARIFGQQIAIEEISKSLWYLTNVKREKPYVIMLYGNSSLGKTELVREIAEMFFNGKFLEKHLSMFKNNNYSEYFFWGMRPTEEALALTCWNVNLIWYSLMNLINVRNISFLRFIRCLIIHNSKMQLMMQMYLVL